MLISQSMFPFARDMQPSRLVAMKTEHFITLKQRFRSDYRMCFKMIGVNKIPYKLKYNVLLSISKTYNDAVELPPRISNRRNHSKRNNQ